MIRDRDMITMEDH